MSNPLKKMTGMAMAFAKMGRYVTFIAPASMLLTAAAVWFSASQISNVIATGAKTAAMAIVKNHPPTITKHSLDPAGYVEVARIISQNNPSVLVKIGDNKTSLSVYISEPIRMPEWMYLLSTLQSYRPGLIWSADSLCLKKCPDNRSASAVLQAYTQEIVVN